MTAQVRAEILTLLDESKAAPSYEQLMQRLGLANKQAVDHHVGVLVGEGLVIRGYSPASFRLTPAGRVAAGYVRAALAGDTLWRYYLKRFFKRYSQAAARAVEAYAAASDRLYPPHRRVTCKAIVRALKSERNLEDASMSGHLEDTITVGALHQRITRMFALAANQFFAAQKLDCRAPHEQAETTEELRTG